MHANLTELKDIIALFASFEFNVIVKHIGLTLLAGYFFIYLLFSVYIIVMGVHRANLQKKLNAFTITLCFPWVVIGYALDVIANIFVVPFIFFELPRELLVTSRLARHLKTPELDRDWRYDLSKKICVHMLDVFDPSGNHCH
jgi:hypothetical protein